MRIADAARGVKDQVRSESSSSSDDGTEKTETYRTIKENPSKYTFDYKGKLMAVKQPNMAA